MYVCMHACMYERTYVQEPEVCECMYVYMYVCMGVDMCRNGDNA